MSSPVATHRNRTILLVVAGVIVAAILVIVVIMAGRSGAQGHYSVANGKVTIETATIGSLGPVLVTDQGYALYMFPPDAQNAVTCTDRCAETWGAGDCASYRSARRPDACADSSILRHTSGLATAFFSAGRFGRLPAGFDILVGDFSPDGFQLGILVQHRTRL